MFLETRSKGDYSICRNGWIADYNDPVSFLDMFMTDNGNNDAHYSNAEYDAIMTKVLSYSDAAGRMELMHQPRICSWARTRPLPPVLLLSALHGGGRCPRHVLHPAGQLPVLPRYQG